MSKVLCSTLISHLQLYSHFMCYHPVEKRLLSFVFITSHKSGAIVCNCTHAVRNLDTPLVAIRSDGK